ncbi:putative leucine-rich repeat receptor-like protein kinase-like [Capsicum annuum]|nr:vacuolar protein sorting-associated protein 2 homolog 3-like [Capsicum annuum]KAF3631020.1 putative leucine-rich repeat receptor-like protein kinase-like [Capsicum annuum]KAF3653681.1 putative leucine-rich repeat receptor-like protein kinase-like [Capsicum annuum]
MVENSRKELTHATGGIDKEISALQSEEQKLVAEIKRSAETNKTATKVLERQVLNLRDQVTILQASRAQMSSITDPIDDVIYNDEVEEGARDLTNLVLVDVASQLSVAPWAKFLEKGPRRIKQFEG